MDAKDIYKLAQIMTAIEKNSKKAPIADMLRNERYQRTMSDQYPWCKTPQPGLRSVPDKQKEEWRKLHDR